MSDTKKYPLGVQSFPEIIEENLNYVDKTQFVYRLVSENKYYFLSRPRRFGKSLLLSTLESFFLGKRELFKGLAIDRHEDLEWLEYPVLHLDFNIQDYADDDNSLPEVLDDALCEWEERFKVTARGSFSLRFRRVIMSAYKKTGRKVVVLVDEYDRPLIQNLKEESLPRQERFRNLLKGFFGILKSCDEYIKFAFLTGVTKFGRVSVFSDLNNLRDISLLSEYNDICGISESELTENFKYGITELGKRNGLSYEETCGRLKRQYDGYRFTGWKVEGIYNPYSLLNALNNREFGNYWFLTATPTMLIDLLKEKDIRLSQLDGTERSENDLLEIDPNFRDPIPLLFQSGYLTIKGMREENEKKIYRLGFPNNEVERGLLDSLLRNYINANLNDGNFQISDFTRALQNGEIEVFINLLTNLLAEVPYYESGDKIYENRFRDIMFIICRLMGMSVHCEIHTCSGRIDMTVETDRFVYIMEFKIDKSPKEALQQINDKRYTDRYLALGRTVMKVGVEFSTKERNIGDWEYEVV